MLSAAAVFAGPMAVLLGIAIILSFILSFRISGDRERHRREIRLHEDRYYRDQEKIDRLQNKLWTQEQRIKELEDEDYVRKSLGVKDEA